MHGKAQPCAMIWWYFSWSRSFSWLMLGRVMSTEVSRFLAMMRLWDCEGKFMHKLRFYNCTRCNPGT